MTLAMQPYVGYDQQFDPHLIENIILQLGDIFEIRIVWYSETVLLAGVCTLAGGLVGRYAGGKVGAAVGAGFAGAAAGLGVSNMVSLRNLWTKIKDKLQDLLYIVFNYLRHLDAIDYFNALKILLASSASKRELVYIIMEFIATKLGCQVISSLAV